MTRNVWLVFNIKHYDDIVRSSFKDEKIKLEIMKTLNQYLQDSNYKIDPNYKLILTDDLLNSPLKLSEYLTVKCKVHGDLQVALPNLLAGHKCRHCMNTVKDTLDIFKNKLKIKHPSLQCISTVYKNSQSKLEFKCTFCNTVFCKTPNTVLTNKHPCNKCYEKARTLKVLKSPEDFIKEAKKIHKGLYSYKFTKYTKAVNKVIVTCKLHGNFNIVARDHTNSKRGCPSCGRNGSKREDLLFSWLRSVHSGTILQNKRFSWLDNKELDIYIPDLNLAVEVNGMYWHSTKLKPDDYHLNKYNKCKEQGINLVHIFEFEDLESWKENLSKYIKNQSKYEVKFENNKRTFSKFSCYGVSKIILLSNE